VSLASSGAMSAPSVEVSYRVLVSVQDGLHRGAAFIAPSADGVLLGHSSECDLVLMDDGVADRALRFFESNGRLTARVFGPGVLFDGLALPLSTKVFDAPTAVIRIGGAEVRVELLRRSVRQPVAAAIPLPTKKSWITPVRRNWVGATLVGLLMAGTFGVVASAVSSSALRSNQQAARTLGDVVQPFNAQGAQLAVIKDAEGRPALRGLVLDALMREKLEQDIRGAGLKADLQLHDVQQMAESLTRLARLSNHPCEARHVEAGRFACDAGVADEPLVARLQALANQVPGVVQLDVHATAPEPKPVVAKAPELPKAEVPVPEPKLPVIRHVVMSEREGMAFDVDGNRLRVGDHVGGAKVTRIEFDKVELMRGKRKYTVSVRPAGLVTGLVAKDSTSTKQTTDEIPRE
jgi:hypothetical protein